MTRWVDAPVIGGAYSDDTRPWSVQDTVNYIPVAAERPGTRSMKMLRGAPGLVPFADLGTNAPVRGMRNVEGLLLAVSGTKLFKVGTNAAVTNLGNIPGVSRVSMSHNQITNGNQVAIANGVGGYVFNTASGVLAPITDEAFPGSKSFDYADSYIMGVEPGGRFAFTSDLADAMSYSTLDRYEAEGSPDLIVGQIVTHREWWIFGKRTIETYQNTGAATTTWQRSTGTVLEVGAASPFAIVNIDNSVVWLGNDGVLYKANGYTPTRISTQALEQAIAVCDLSKAFMFTYEDRGHKIVYLTFQDGKTWGYDIATQEIHRRQSKNLDRWRINTLVQWNGMWIAGDYQNGKLYRLDWNVASEDGQTLERRRITGVLHDNQNAVIVNAIALVFNTGMPQAPTAEIPLNITGNAPDGVVGVAMSYGYWATGGQAPLTFSITSGALPTGVTLNAMTGVISGTPTTAQTAVFTVTVTDANGKSASDPDTIVVASVAYSSLILSDNPVFYLPLNETSGATAADLTGHGHSGTYSENTAHDSTALRPGGRSLKVQATGGYVSVPNFVECNTIFQDLHPWSAEILMKRVGDAATSAERLFGKFVNSNTGNSVMAMDVAVLPTHTVSGYFNSAEGGGQQIASDPVPVANGTVYHYMTTFDGATIKIYRNGEVVGSAEVDPGSFGQNVISAFTFGGSDGFPASYQFNGYLSDAALYDYAMTADRVLAHAQAAGLA